MFNASMFRAFASGTGNIEWKFVIHIGGKHLYHWYLPNYANQMEHFKMKRPPCLYHFVLSGEADCGNLGNRYHEAKLLNNLDEFFDLNQILVSFTYS